MNTRLSKLFYLTLEIISIFCTVWLSGRLGIDSRETICVIIAAYLICMLEPNSAFYYYLIVAVTEAVSYLLYSFVMKDYIYMYLPLVALAFSAVLFVVWIIKRRKDE